MAGPNTQHQTPNTKKLPTAYLQTTGSALFLKIEVWSFFGV
jgi:hypothetical protein